MYIVYVYYVYQVLCIFKKGWNGNPTDHGIIELFFSFQNIVNVNKENKKLQHTCFTNNEMLLDNLY